jgi:hypothetical protein
MLAALKALECLTASSFSTSIELRVDNTSAISYINWSGSCRSVALCSVALSIASWCESKDLELHTIFLPGVSNMLADAESQRPLSSGDWKLSVAAFKSIPPIGKCQSTSLPANGTLSYPSLWVGSLNREHERRTRSHWDGETCRATHSSVQPDPKLFVEINQWQGVVKNGHTLLAQSSPVSVPASDVDISRLLMPSPNLLS